ncbi:MAG: DUF4124 domain-containing protein [Gammaproteobacteria bacterium]
MGKLLLAFAALSITAMLSGAAFADGLQVYKWTDLQGVVHYSDKPPPAPAVDLLRLDLPKLPPIDPKKIAATDAWIASINEMVRRQQAQEALAQQQLELKQQAADSQQYATVVQEPAPIYIGYARPRLAHHRDRDDHRHIRHISQRTSAAPTWPFPYNLNESSFPEEWHKP